MEGPSQTTYDSESGSIGETHEDEVDLGLRQSSSFESLESLATLDIGNRAVQNDEVGLLGQPTAYLIGIAEQSGKSDLRMAFMNMANSIIGAGIIGQAYAIRQAGFLGGIFLLIVLTVVIDWTIRLMVTNAKFSATKTYQETVKHCFGKPGLVVVSLAQGAFAFGGSMAYCVIIGDTVPHVLKAMFPKLVENHPFWHWLFGRGPIIVIFSMGISYPLSLSKNIAALAKASALALVSMVIITLTVAIRGPALAPDDSHMSVPLWTVNSGFFRAVSVISFAFVCHHNSLIIYDSLKNPSTTRFAIVTHWSTGVSMVACMVLGLSGFLSFKNKTLGNILNNFPATDTMANVARFCFGFNMVTTLPLEIFVCREVAQGFFYPNAKESWIRHVVITTVLMITAVAVALSTCNLGVILELVGASSACCMAYILPPMCYLRLSQKPRRHPSKIACYSSITFGAVVMAISTVQTFIKVASGQSEGGCVE